MVTYGFYNALNHDRVYDATQMSSIFDGIINDGIFESIGTHLSVSANSGMDISIGIGRAWFNSTWTLNDSILPLTVDEAEVVLDRIDAVVLEVNSSTEVRANAIKIVKGTPSSNPVAPTMIETEEVHQHRLANITVGAGVTEITQAEIENFIGTEETPFITGILETMSVDTLVAQWQTEYRQMKDADHTAYTSSLTADHNAYVQQREADDASFDTWFAEKMEEVIAWYENLQVQIDDNVAVNLQNQIGTLSLLSTQTKTNLVAAINELVAETYPCFIRVTCAEEFAGDAVELIYGGEVIKTKLIPSSAPYVVEFGVKETGQYTLREVAYDITTTVNVSNYTIYNAGLYLGSITLAVDEDFIGTTITCTDGTTTKEWLCDGLTHVFSVGLGTWVISGTIDDETYSTTVVVTDYINYPAELRIETAEWPEWVTAGGLSPSGYDDLDDILADESAIRTLMTKHDAVDFLVEWAEEDLESIRKIIRNDLCAKWINLRDYALDTLYSSETIKYEMDHSAVTALVPKLTSNTGTNGEAFANDESRQASWKAFDGDDTTFCDGNLSSDYNVGYHFSKPTVVTSIYIKPYYESGLRVKSFKIQASNDNSNWIDLTNTITFANTSGYSEYINISKDKQDEYSYYRLLVNDSYSGAIRISSLQFYGYGDSGERAPLVPTMTSNTTPSGEAIKSSEYYHDGYYPAYKAFDRITSAEHIWVAESNSNEYVGYDFGSPVVVKTVTIKTYNTSYTYPQSYAYKNAKIQGSNDGSTWYDLESWLNTNSNVLTIKPLNNDDAYRYYRFLIIDNYGAMYTGGIDELQFYSELPTGTKYFLGEWALLPQVPKMTSNSAPYGEVTSSTIFESNYAWYAFDDNISTAWLSKDSNPYLIYEFVYPVCAKKVLVKGRSNDTPNFSFCKEFSVEASNDGTNWVTLLDKTTNNSWKTYSFENDNYYKYYRFTVYSTDDATGAKGVYSLQFYSWGPKGAVPVMTSNSAPYGVASASNSASDTAPWHAFDGNPNVKWNTNNITSNSHITYKFSNPINVKRVAFFIDDKNIVKTFKVQVSNDGTTFTDLTETITNDTQFGDYKLENNNYYLYYRIYVFTATANIGFNILQFYGRQLTVSVPKMTSNTEPWGVASASSNLDTTKVAYKAFDKVSTNEWHSAKGNFPYDLGYEFDSEVCLKQVVITNRNTSITIDYGIKTAEIQGSNDGATWEKIGNDISMADTKGGVFIFNFENNVAYKRLRVHILDSYHNADETYVSVGELQFYGLDYSEHSERHWIYDHGVEVEEVTQKTVGTGSVATKEDSVLSMSITNNGQVYAGFYLQKDLTDYDLTRCVIEDIYSSVNNNGSTFTVFSGEPTYTGSEASSQLNLATNPYDAFMDISNINGTKYIDIECASNNPSYAKQCRVSVNEWWLE